MEIFLLVTSFRSPETQVSVTSKFPFPQVVETLETIAMVDTLALLYVVRGNLYSQPSSLTFMLCCILI